jgi:hypothetical protein
MHNTSMEYCTVHGKVIYVIAIQLLDGDQSSVVIDVIYKLMGKVPFDFNQ